jgi:hypothetical protein
LSLRFVIYNSGGPVPNYAVATKKEKAKELKRQIKNVITNLRLSFEETVQCKEGQAVRWSSQVKTISF